MIELALRYDLPLVATDLSNADAARIVRGGDAAVFNAAALTDPNTAALVAARGYTFGDMPRVTSEARMGWYLSEDFNFLKRTKITENTGILLQVSMINAFNRHIWNRPPDLNPYDAAFGQVDWKTYSSTGGGGYLLGPRKVQLQLKFEF